MTSGSQNNKEAPVRKFNLSVVVIMITDEL